MLRRSSTVFFYSTLTLALVILALHFVTIWMAPFKSVFPTSPAIAILAAYLVAFFIITRLVLVLGRLIKRTDGQATGRQLSSVLSDRRLRALLLLVSIFGVALHAWSKYYLTELRPISCISEIRFAWLEVSRDVLPIQVRVASVLGHLLTSFAYLGMLATSFTIGRSKTLASIPRSEVAHQLIFTLVGAIYAGFIGSRNAMLAFLAMSFAGLIMGMATRDQSSNSDYSLPPLVAALLVPTFGMLVFSSVVFSDRLFCRTPDALTSPNGQHVSAARIAAFHMTGNYREFALRVRAQDEGADWREAVFVDGCPICGPAMVYANHGIFNLSRTIGSEERGTPVLLGHLGSWARRFGIDMRATDGEMVKRVYGPGGLTLAGAAYHDYGLAGVLIMATILGILFGQSILWMQSNGIRALIGVWLFCCIFYMLFISSIFVGFSVLPFPFVAFGVGAGLAVWAFMNWLFPLSLRHGQRISV